MPTADPGADAVAVHPRWPALDGVRGIAVLIVVVYHLELPSWFPFSRGGFLGVELFFVLSGFLITALLVGEFNAGRTIALGRFYARRVIRLQPAQWALALFVAVVAVTFAPADTRTSLLAGIPSSLLYFSNWVKAFGWWNQGALTHTWSLAIEEQYYLVWPPIVLVCLRAWGRRGAVWLAAGGVVVTFGIRFALYAGGASQARLYNGTDARAGGLMVGSLIGAAVGAGVLTNVKRPEWLTAAGIGGAVVLSVIVLETRFLLGVSLSFIDLVIGLGIVGCVFLPASTLVGRALSARPLVAVGRVSYGLYLWHKAIIVLFNGERFGLTWWQEAAVEIVVFSAATIVSWKVIEQPLSRFRHRFAVPVAVPDAQPGTESVTTGRAP